MLSNWLDKWEAHDIMKVKVIFCHMHTVAVTKMLVIVAFSDYKRELYSLHSLCCFGSYNKLFCLLQFL